jgi:hypothetical protein
MVEPLIVLAELEAVDKQAREEASSLSMVRRCRERERRAKRFTFWMLVWIERVRVGKD